MPRPVCVPCARFYRTEKNGFRLTESMPAVDGAKPGKNFAHQWKPYKLWCADKWKCPGCGHEMVTGFGHACVRNQHEPDFDELRIKDGFNDFVVNDC